MPLNGFASGRQLVGRVMTAVEVIGAVLAMLAMQAAPPPVPNGDVFPGPWHVPYDTETRRLADDRWVVERVREVVTVVPGGHIDLCWEGSGPARGDLLRRFRTRLERAGVARVRVVGRAACLGAAMTPVRPGLWVIPTP
jgi:hypothetical protein